MASFTRRFGPVYEAISSDIYKLCDAMNFYPTPQQRLLCDAVMRAQRGTGPLQIAVKSGQGPGKTTISVIVAIFRCLQAVGALTLLTAPTMRQCREIWLAECRRVLMRADPDLQRLITVTRTRVNIANVPDWGVQTITATKEENAAGFHEPNMTIICEESSGISRPIIETFKGTSSNPNCLFLMIGNPNSRDCAFFDCFHTLRHMWECITFNAEETPKSKWFDPIRNLRLEEEFGRDSDVYRVRVLGEFPHVDPNCVISSEQVEAANDKKRYAIALRLARADGTLAKQFGIDFARYGSDESVYFRRSGMAIVDWKKFAHTEPARVVEQCFRVQADAQWKDDECWYVADAGGMGQGMMHKFHDAGKQIVEFHNNNVAADQQYDNRITEAWFHLARLLRSNQPYIPKDNLLTQQLAGRHYYTTKKGKLVLESKDEYMKRGFDSPDRADAAVLAYYDAVTASGNIAVRGPSTRRVGNW